MKENWGRKEMPPVYYDVKHRAITFRSDHTQAETVWVAGHHPHLGKTIGGWSGDETVVKRHIIFGPMQGMETTPRNLFPIIRIEQ